MDEDPSGGEAPSSSQLRFFRSKNKTQNESKSDNSKQSNIDVESNRSDKSSVPIQAESAISDGSPTNDEGQSITDVGVSENSVSGSISEHIIKDDSVEVSLTNRENSHTNLSIPSLHLKSLSKSDSDYGGQNPSRGNRSKLSISESHDTVSHSEAITDRSPSDLVDSLEKSRLSSSISNKTSGSKHKRHKKNHDNISDESPIPIELDSSISSHLSNDESFHDSLSKNSNSNKSNRKSAIDEKSKIDHEEKRDSIKSSSSEEILKVDIRGTATRGFPFEKKMLIFGNIEALPTLENNDYIALNDNIVDLTTLGNLPALPPLKKSNESITNIKIETQDVKESPILPVKNVNEKIKHISRVKIEAQSNKSEDFEQDYDIEELILNESRDIFPSKDNDDNIFMCNITNKPGAEGESSISTVTTEYKTLCEEFMNKTSDLQAVLDQREHFIEELKTSLNNSLDQNEYLTVEVGKLQQLLSNATAVGGEIKGHLSDFAKHEYLLDDNDPEIFDSYAITKDMNEPTNKQYSKKSSSTQTQDVIDVADCSINAVDVKSKPFSETDYLRPNIFTPGFEEFQNELDNNQIPLFEKFREKLVKLLEGELHSKYEMFIADINYLREKLSMQENSSKSEMKRLRDLLQSIKSNNPDISDLRNEMEIKHQKEMEELRTYFEQKCTDMEKHYSEEVFSQQSKKISANSSVDSLNNCVEALPFGSPLRGTSTTNLTKLQRSHSVEFQLGVPHEKFSFDNLIKDMKIAHESQKKDLIKRFETQISDLVASHESFVQDLEEDYKDQISELKGHLQTYQNTEIHGGLYDNRDADLELEKKDSGVVLTKREPSENVQNAKIDTAVKNEALLSGPNDESTSWPLNLIALKDKIETEAQQAIEELKMTHAEELATLREENTKNLTIESQKHAAKEEEWRSKRYEAFDKNRHLEDVVKERDGLKHITNTLQRVLSQLVEYFNLCEDELNNTFVGELLKQVVIADENFDNTIVLNCGGRTPNSSSNPSLNNSIDNDEQNITTLSTINSSKKMHFAPDVNGIITYIDSECTFNDVDQSQDISANFKNHLDSCLMRLRVEAQELLAISSHRINKRLSILPNESSKILEKVDEEVFNSVDERIDLKEYEFLKTMFEKSEITKKELEESLAQSMYQEAVLREELHLAMDKIAELVNDQPLNETVEMVSEGYGVVTHPRVPVSLPPHPRVSVTSPPPLLGSEGNTPEGGRSLSVDGLLDKRTFNGQEALRRLNCELETATREREDIQMQLEAANKQLRSTRQFLEEQAAEREQERDEFQRELELLKEENNKLTSKTQHHVRICKEVEQLEVQMRDMSGLITSIENQKNDVESELKASVEKTGLLRDIIGNLENQLETKIIDESNLLKELASYKELVEERELKMKDLAGELEKLKDDLAEKIAGDALAAGERNVISIAKELETEKKLVEQMRGQLHALVETIADHTNALENLHEAVCSQSCSSPSEDVSIQDQKKKQDLSEGDSSHFVMPASPTKLMLQLPLLEMSRLDESLHRHLKAEGAAIKRIRDLEMQLIQLKDVAQELRTERDILQERMSEQSLRISSLQSRLDQTRHTAEAMTHQSTEDLRLQLDEALSETQLLREALDSRDKQVGRLKALVESTKKRLCDQEQELSACTGSSKEIIMRLKRELREQQARNREILEDLEESRLHNKSMPEIIESVVADKNADIDLLKQQLLEKEEHLQAVLSFKLEEDDVLKHISNSEKDLENQAKLSARTLSDILSISEFDEPEMMRKALIQPQASLSGNINVSFNANKNQNITAMPEMGDKIAPLAMSPRLQNMDKEEDNKEISFMDEYKRNVNETTMFGVSLKSDNHSSAKKSMKNVSAAISDNCSVFPNKNATDDKEITIEPKRIDFSVVNSSNEDDKKHDFVNILRSLEEMGVIIDIDGKSSFEILSQIKNYITAVQNELDSKQDALVMAEEQLAEFPIVKNEMDDLKAILENSLKTMQEDKQYYNSQLEKFSAGEKNLKEKLEKAVNDVNEKAHELQILKEDILRRENFVLELAKEKRSLSQSLSEVEAKCKTLESGLILSGKKEMNVDLSNFEQLITEKNQQIDNLNANLDKLDDIQRELNEYKNQVGKLGYELNQKCSELESITKINKDLELNNQYLIQENKHLENQQNNLKESNYGLQLENNKFKESLLKLENDFINASQKTIKDNQLGLDVDNHEELAKYEEFKILLDELENLNSPIISDAEKRQEKWNLKKIRLHLSALQTELNAKGKDLNIKVFELERAKLEIIDLKKQCEELTAEKNEIKTHLKDVTDKLREEGDLQELHIKLTRKIEECSELESELLALRGVLERYQRDSNSDRERDDRLQDLSMENGRLKQHLYAMENKISDQDNMISELNEVKDSLVADLQDLEEKSEVEKDTSTRLQILLDTEKQMSSNIQCQDSNVIQILKGRLEVALDSESELKMLLEREKKSCEQLLKQVDSYKKQLECVEGKTTSPDLVSTNNVAIVLQEKLESLNSQVEHQVEITELVKSELMLLKTKYDREKSRLAELQNICDRDKLCFQKEMDTIKEQSATLRAELAELMRQKHDMHLELVHSREKLHLQKNENLTLEKRLCSLQESQRSLTKSDSYRALLNEVEQRNMELNLEVTSLKQKLDIEKEKNLHMLFASDRKNTEKAGTESESATLYHLKEMQTLLRRHIAENVQISETVKELTRERKELQFKVKQLEHQIEMNGLKRTVSTMHLPDDVDQQVRFLYGRYMRMNSYRKNLVWQKQYLVRVVAAFKEWEMKITNPEWPIKSRGRKRFKCIILAVRGICRMKYLVKRWHTTNDIASNVHLNIPNVFPTELRSSKSYTHIPISPTPREKMTRSRYSLANPNASYHSPPTKGGNKTWSLGGGVSSTDRLMDRHLMNQNTLQPPLRSNLLYRDASGTFSDSDRWHFSNNAHLLRGSHPELPEFLEENYPLPSPTSENGTSSAFSRYVSRSDVAQMARPRTLNSSRDPL